MVRAEKYRKSVAASVEIEHGPLGLSNINVKVGNSSVVGIGACTSRVNGHSWGLLHFNEESDLSPAEFKLYCILQENSQLRIDFVRIELHSLDEQVVPWEGAEPEDPDYEVPKLVFEGSRPGSEDCEIAPFVGALVFE
ncbi:LAFA_0B07514g1_1 [Lachancea sp. 'fantastica']|nr:LAFA_0B07514g1_1 [Lachancea sp. 'fantastica']